VSGLFFFFTGRLTGHLLLDFLTKEIASVVVTAMLGFRRSEVAEKLGYGCFTPKKFILSKNTIYTLKNLFMTLNNPKINFKTKIDLKKKSFELISTTLNKDKGKKTHKLKFLYQMKSIDTKIIIFL
jgi:hypothetical protein